MAQYLDLEGTKILVNKIKANTNNKLDKTANAVSASKLQTARTITIADNIVGNARFDGSGDITINARLTRQDLTGKTTDLNTLTHSDGTYSRRYIETTTGGCANISNAPVKEPFILDVELIRYSSSTDYISKQVFTSATTKKVYERYCTNGTWSSWGQVYTTTNKPTKADVGLGNVDNTSDLNKPISTATQNALNGKANSSHTHDDRYYTETEINDKLNGKANSSHTHTKSQITDMPTSLKNPTALTVQFNGTTNKTYDGSSAQTVNITPSAIGASASSHTHNYAGSSSAGGSANSAVKLATARGITIGNTKKTFDGSVDVSWNLSDIGAYTKSEIDTKLNGKANSSHTHDDRYYTETEINNKLSTINTNIAQLSNPNLLINGDFQVWSKGTSFTANATNTYTADKWHLATLNPTITVSRISDTQLSITNSSAFANNARFGQYVEVPPQLRGQMVTLSMNVNCTVAQNVMMFGTTYDGSAVQNIKSAKITLTPNQTTYSLTFKMPTTPYVYIGLALACSNSNYYGSSGAMTLLACQINIFWVKLELGSIATPFVSRPYAQELQDCLMYNGDELTAPYSNPNLLINGDFQVWQRGTSFTCAGGIQYTADRWTMWTGKTPMITYGGGQQYLNWAGAGNDNLIQVIELPSSAIGRAMTLSFNIFVESGVTISYGVNNGTTVTGADKTQEISQSYTGTSKWEIITLSIPNTLPTNEKMRVFFACGSIGTNKLIALKWVKLELGSVATPFVPRPYGEELQLCQRYYEKSYDVTVSPATDTGYGRYLISKNPIDNAFYGTIPFKVTKRTQPTIIAYKPNGTKLDISGVSSSTSTIDINVGSSSALLDLQWTADAEIY